MVRNPAYLFARIQINSHTMLYSSEECAKKLSACSEKLYDEKLAALRKRLQGGDLNMDEFTRLSYELKQERC